MTRSRPLQVAAVGLALSFALSSARADILKSLCKDHEKHDQKSGSSSRSGPERTGRRDFAPMVGTVYMPMALPMFGFGGSRDADTAREVNTLSRAADRALLSAAQHERDHLVLQAEIKAAERILQRMAGAGTGAAAVPEDITKKLDKLSKEIEVLHDRMVDIEKLLIYHDNWIRKLPKTPEKPADLPLPGADKK